jgi:hypothetical protein
MRASLAEKEVLLISLFAVTPAQNDGSPEPLAMIEEYLVKQRSLGLDHPEMRELRERILDLASGDLQPDLPQVQKRLDELTYDRSLLLQTRGLTHPEVVENATRLSLMSRLLAGESVAILREISRTRGLRCVKQHERMRVREQNCG